MQDKNLYDDLSSPTISTQSLFMILCIAQSEKRKIACADIDGAYLNANMGKQEVIMKIDPYVSELLCYPYPKYLKHIVNSNDSCIYVKLRKALYGCVESARLFYLHVKKSLNDLGFKENNYDKCVFNKTIDKTQITVVMIW